jgi:hypothetical protein
MRNYFIYKKLKSEISHVKGFHMKLQAVAAPGLRNWGGRFERQTHIWGGGKIELLNS